MDSLQAYKILKKYLRRADNRPVDVLQYGVPIQPNVVAVIEEFLEEDLERYRSQQYKDLTKQRKKALVYYCKCYPQ